MLRTGSICCWLAVATATGCAQLSRPAPLGEYLDESTGTTVVHMATPAVYYREVPTLAAHARDYISLAPLELSQGGRRERFLWTWRWSTIDRGVPALESSPHMVLFVDDEPMELEPAGPRSLARWPYEAPVNGGERALFYLTRNQVERLGAARQIRVYVAGGEYLPWRAGDPDLSEFAHGTDTREAAALAQTHD